jgi:flavin-dependent dehydrogenase
MTRPYDVVILGGGLAGQTLARHILLETDKKILMLERRDHIPWFHQKVGESSVQIAGHYFGKILGLESYLLHEHFMKYNLRFYFRSGARKNDNFEDYGHISIRPFSNVPSYQLNRNTLEAEIFRRNQEEKDRFTVEIGAQDLDVEIVPDGLHRIQYRMGTETRQAEATWVLDASGRNRFLARKLGLRKPMAIHNNTFFWWVEGTVDIEKLTSRSRQEIRLKRERGTLGHLPVFLATNHFCVEGLWFWVIPLQGKTSLGLVYDSKVLRHGDINSVEKATAWVLEHFPLFARDLPNRKVLDWGTIIQYSHDCERTIHPHRWAMTARRDASPIPSTARERSDLALQHDDRERHPDRRSRGARGCHRDLRADAKGARERLRAQLRSDLRLPGRPGGLLPEVRLGAVRLLRRVRVPVHQRPLQRPPVPRGLHALLQPPGSHQPRPAPAAQRFLQLEEGARPARPGG